MAAPKQTDPQFKLRMTPEIKEAIEKAAGDNNRSMNAEILARLEDSFVATRKEAAQIAAVSDLVVAVVARVGEDLRREGKSPQDFMNWLRSFPEFDRLIPNRAIIKDADGKVLGEDE